MEPQSSATVQDTAEFIASASTLALHTTACARSPDTAKKRTKGDTMHHHLTRATAITAAMLTIVSLAACGGDGNADSANGRVYFMNNKPEVVDQYERLAKLYTDKTGIPVDVQTGAAGTYDTMMKSELAKSDAPTMFNISGFDQFATYKDHIDPLQDTDVFKLLNDEGRNYSYTVDGNSYTLPYAAEWYGIIYNKKIVDAYCSKDYAVIATPGDITGYDTLKKVAESMQQHKDDLGIDGAFATPGLDASDTYRFTAHMARIPLYYEYKDMDTTFSKTITGKYLNQYRDLFDLELRNSPTEPSMISTKTYDDVTAEFALGKVAFYPNGVWSYSQIKGNNVADDDLGMLPYYMGIDGEDQSGPAGVYDASWAVNTNASDKDKKATLDFIKWMVTDSEAKRILSHDMGFSVPFSTFTDEYRPDNPLAAAAQAHISEGKAEVRSFTIPDQQWQDDIVSALMAYAQGTGEWGKVRDAFVDGWSTEWGNNEESLGTLPEARKFNE